MHDSATAPVGEPAPKSWVDKVLSSEVMGFLAIAALGMALQELVFGAPKPVHQAIRYCQILVFALFGTEYFYSLVRAESKLHFLRQPQRLFDLFVLVIAAISFSPYVEDRLLNAQALQILRLGPILFFGYLGTKEISVSLMAEGDHAAPPEKVDFFRLQSIDGPMKELEPISQEQALEWVANPDRKGFYICRGNVTRQLADALSDADIPSSLLENALSQSSFPRVLKVGAIYVLAGAVPTVAQNEPALPSHVHRVTFVAVFTNESVLLINNHGLSISHEVLELLDREQILKGHSEPFRIFGGLFKLVLEKYEVCATEIEAHLRQTEMAPLGKSGGGIYRMMYFLRRALSNLKSDLWRLRYILHGIEAGDHPTIFGNEDTKGFFSLLAHSCDFHYDNFEQLDDKASAILDLRINLVSFEMNKFMGLLAVVTAIGLIPATFGGMLGMNVIGTNFPITLGNVAFICLVLSLMVLYVMQINGWLKFR